MKAAAPCIALLLWLCAIPLAAAADLGDAVPGHAGVTYLDLMKLVATDLGPLGKDGAVGHKVVPFTHIDGEDARGDPPETITLAAVDALTIPGDQSRIVLLADLGPSEGFVADAVLLALFALAPAPKLLDVVEVGTDRFTGFADAKGAMLAPGVPLILVYNSHSNSDQSYLSTKMMFVRGDRFQLMGDVFTLGERACGYEHTQEPSFATLPGPGPYRALHVSVLERVAVTGEECGDQKAPRPRVATCQAIYRWDARRGRFMTRSKELDRLADKNRKAF
jgi:hypothetical protein